MADPDELLAESVRESLRHSDRRVLAGLLLAVFYAALTFGELERPDGVVSVPFIGLETDTTTAGWIALGLSWVSIAAAAAALEGLEGTVAKIAQRDLRIAALTYPAFVTSKASGWAYGPPILLFLFLAPAVVMADGVSVPHIIFLFVLFAAPASLAIMVRQVRRLLKEPEGQESP